MTRTITLHVRVSEEVSEALSAMAKAEERPLASLLAILLRRAVIPRHDPSAQVRTLGADSLLPEEKRR